MRQVNRIRKKWSEEEIKTIREMYPDNYNKDIAKKINRTVNGVQQKAIKLKLKKSSEFMEKCEKGTQFKEGHEPFNKGKNIEEYISEESYSKIQKTQFKKGHKPANSKHGNSPFIRTRIRKDVIEKIWFVVPKGRKKPVMYLRHLWEQKHGKLRSNQIITYKDNPIFDRLPTLEDLKVITRKENLVRNFGGYEDTRKYAINILKQRGIKNPTEAMIKAYEQNLINNKKIKDYENK